MRHLGFSRKNITRTAVASLLLSPLLLAGCGSTAQKTVSVAKSRPIAVKETPLVNEVTPEHKLVEAKKVWSDMQNKALRDSLLLEAAQLYMLQQKPIMAQQILYEVKQDGVSPENQSFYALLMAKVYANQSDVSAEELLSLLEPVSGNKDLLIEKAHLQAQLFAKDGNYSAAANSLLNTDLPDEQKVEQVWKWITSMPVSSLDDIAQQYSALSPFVSLRKLTEEYSSSPEKLAENLNNFQKVYAGHSLGATFPDDVLNATKLQRANINAITVLLPLSGRLATTGSTVKNGIMAAYYQSIADKQGNEVGQDQRNLPTLHFIDTVDKDVNDIIAEIGDAKFIIGPLLKSNVERIIPALPVGVNVLALNRSDDITQIETPFNTSASNSQQLILNDVQYSNNAQYGDKGKRGDDNTLESAQSSANGPIAANFFALAPEDEAKQLAELIFNKGFRAPIVITEQSSLYERMDDTFKSHWESLNKAEGKYKTNITSVTFNDSNSLREGITSALDVAQSNERINQIEYMTNDEVYNMPRSRRDIDAIIAFASPQDTELLNPIIEASLNPLGGKPIPVYATSRSMDYESGKNQWRDLKNIHFIDMPWMMPQHQWKPLAQTVEQAFDGQNTMQKRLFAFGYDAYELLPKLGILNTLNYLHHNGLTGALSLNENGEVERKQPTAIIRNEKVESISE